MKLIINNRKMYLGSIKSFNISNCAVAEIVVGVAGYSVELECNLDPAIKGITRRVETIIRPGLLIRT